MLHHPTRTLGGVKRSRLERLLTEKAVKIALRCELVYETLTNDCGTAYQYVIEPLME